MLILLQLINYKLYIKLYNSCLLFTKLNKKLLISICFCNYITKFKKSC